MLWLLIAMAIYGVIFVAGRAHSRHLDRLEAQWRLLGDVRRMTSDLSTSSVQLIVLLGHPSGRPLSGELESEANVLILSRLKSQTPDVVSVSDRRNGGEGDPIPPEMPDLVAGETATVETQPSKVQRGEPQSARVFELSGHASRFTQKDNVGAT